MEDSDIPTNNQPLTMKIDSEFSSDGNMPNLVSGRRLEGSGARFRGGTMVPWGAANCESFDPKNMEAM
jgi:hypothetical protein